MHGLDLEHGPEQPAQIAKFRPNSRARAVGYFVGNGANSWPIRLGDHVSKSLRAASHVSTRARDGVRRDDRDEDNAFASGAGGELLRLRPGAREHSIPVESLVDVVLDDDVAVDDHMDDVARRAGVDEA